jgi:hypothetical protein
VDEWLHEGQFKKRYIFVTVPPQPDPVNLTEFFDEALIARTVTF